MQFMVCIMHSCGLAATTIEMEHAFGCVIVGLCNIKNSALLIFAQFTRVYFLSLSIDPQGGGNVQIR